MRRKIDISLKKQAKQSRAIATFDSIVEAATYILKRNGAAGFTANKVVEKAGVNIASFYQYFPNKEALLFQITKMHWEKQLVRLAPILNQRGPGHAKRLLDFVREFFLVEASEVDLRQALRLASVDLRDTKEYRALISEGTELFRGFIEDAMKGQKSEDLGFDVDFVSILITSFAEKATDTRSPDAVLIRQADVLSHMLIAHFKIA